MYTASCCILLSMYGVSNGSDMCFLCSTSKFNLPQHSGHVKINNGRQDAPPSYLHIQSQVFMRYYQVFMCYYRLSNTGWEYPVFLINFFEKNIFAPLGTNGIRSSMDFRSWFKSRWQSIPLIVDGDMDEVHGTATTSSLTTFRDDVEAPWYEFTKFFFNSSIFPLRDSSRIHLNSIRAPTNIPGRGRMLMDTLLVRITFFLNYQKV